MRQSMRRRQSLRFRLPQATAASCCRSATTASAERLPAAARDSSACKIASRRWAGRSALIARPAAEPQSSSRFRSMSSQPE
jgi:hypothetical protein